MKLRADVCRFFYSMVERIRRRNPQKLRAVRNDAMDDRAMREGLR
jgi:hypothetical protein